MGQFFNRSSAKIQNPKIQNYPLSNKVTDLLKKKSSAKQLLQSHFPQKRLGYSVDTLFLTTHSFLMKWQRVKSSVF